MSEPAGRHCPGCGSEPLQVGVELNAQCFCPNDECHVLMWNPTLGLQELAEDANFIQWPEWLRE
jgi:hypothetical protein